MRQESVGDAIFTGKYRQPNYMGHGELLNPTTKAPSKPKIMVSPLAMYERGGWYHPDLVTFLLTVSRYSKKYTIIFNPAHQIIPAAGARNLLATRMQEVHKADWLLMIDNDVVPPPNLLDMLDSVTDDMDVVVPLCHMWVAEKAIPMTVMRPVGLKANDFNDLRVEKADMPEWVELEITGTGCVLVRRGVFEKMKYPYFEYIWTQDGCLDTTEDITFSHKARGAGCRIWLNTRFTARHHHTVDLSQIQLPAPEHTSGPPTLPSLGK